MSDQKMISRSKFAFISKRPKPKDDGSDIPLPPTDDGPNPAPIIEPPDAPPDVHNPGQTPVREPDPKPPKQIVSSVWMLKANRSMSDDY